MGTTSKPARAEAPAPMSVFDRYLTVWGRLCIVVGIGLGLGLGQMLPGPFQAIGRMEVAQVNLPVGLLIGVMVIPMQLEVDFGALHQVRRHWRGIGATLFVNWAVKPLSMAPLGWIFIRLGFAPCLPAGQIDSDIAGLILLAAAPCTAITAPWGTLLTSVLLYTGIPVAMAQAWRKLLLARGQAAFEAAVAKIGPWSITALLATVVGVLLEVPVMPPGPSSHWPAAPVVWVRAARAEAVPAAARASRQAMTRRDRRVGWWDLGKVPGGQ